MTIVECVQMARQTRQTFARAFWQGKACCLLFWCDGVQDGIGDCVWQRASAPVPGSTEHKVREFRFSVDDLVSDDWHMVSL